MKPACPFSTAAEEISAICRRTFQKPDARGIVSRTFHRNSHACLSARLIVDDGLAPELAQGLFAKGGQYRAWVRFSSALLQSDRSIDTQGIAVKLLDAPGETFNAEAPGEQDLLAVNQPVVITANEQEALEFFRKIDGCRKLNASNMIPFSFLFPSLLPLKVRSGIFPLILDAVKQSILGRDLARMTFYSATPYRLGEGAMKFGFFPEKDSRKRWNGSIKNNLKRRLAAGSIRFRFMIQRSLDPVREPIDDATRLWKSPFELVGSLEIPPQDFETKERAALDQRISFSPWNCLKCHEPLGSLNEARRIVYRDAAARRTARMKMD